MAKARWVGEDLIAMHKPKEKYSRIDGLLAHRVVWAHHHGPIPPGHDVHHLCHVKRCIRIEHLDCLPSGQHITEHRMEYSHNRAKTHCKRGHEFTPENSAPASQGRPGRRCRACHQEDNRNQRARRR
jgi:hypothetical protein